MSLETEKRDLQCVIDYVSSLGYADMTKLILTGESQGGLVSCLVAAERQTDKLILLYPALCIPDDARRGKMLFIRFDPENIDSTLKSGFSGFRQIIRNRRLISTFMRFWKKSPCRF